MNSFSIDQDLSVIIGRILNISKFLYASNIHTSYSGKETTFSVSPKELTFNLCFHDATFYLHFDEKDPKTNSIIDLDDFLYLIDNCFIKKIKDVKDLRREDFLYDLIEFSALLEMENGKLTEAAKDLIALNFKI